MTQSLVQEFSNDVQEEERLFISTLATQENQEVVLADTVEPTENVEINVQKTILDGFRNLIKEAKLNKDNFEDFLFNFNVTDAITNILGEEKTLELNLTLDKKMSYHRIFRNLCKKAVGSNPAAIELEAN